MHGNHNTRFLTDRQRAEHAVPAMVLWLMIWNNTKDLMPEDADMSHLHSLHDYALEMLNTPTLQRRGDRMYSQVCDWMVKSKFSTRKAIFVLTQFLSLLWDAKAITLDPDSKYFAALQVIGGLYDDHLEEAVGQGYQKFEKSSLKAVYELALKFQANGYYPNLNFTKAI